MPRIRFGEMPDDGRLWVFGLGRDLSTAEEAGFLGAVDNFPDSWAAHGAALRCAGELRHGRFLLVAVDEASIPPSGCSIDAMVRVLKQAEVQLDTTIVDHTAVWFLDSEGVQRVDRATFGTMARAGTVSPDTTVFDNTVTRVRQLRDGEWEAPAREAWHGRAFF